MFARRRTEARPGLESLEGRRLTASLAGALTTTITAEVDSVAKPKPAPTPPPNPTPPIVIELSDVLISSYS